MLAVAALVVGSGGGTRGPSVGLVRLPFADLGLAVVSPGGLVATDSAGRSMHQVGPRLPQSSQIDDLAFLDRRHGWVVDWDLNDVGVGVYRTSDRGRTWKHADVTAHSMAAGSVATIQFLDLRHGWLVNQQPTAPDAALYASTDGGAHWRLVRRSLPEIAPVLFTTTRRAWQAGGPFGRSLFRSTDGGRMWKEVHLPLPTGTQRALYNLPTVFGRRVLDAVSSDRELRIYGSLDNGATWKLESRLRLPRSSADDCAPPPVSLPTNRAWWAAAYSSGGWRAYATEDAGRHWRFTLISRARAPAACAEAPSMQAVDAKTAWFRFTVGEREGRLYATDDGGRHWRRLLLNMS
jgi:photosystem II stability/assembly factor-like uncharacterized protein